MNAQNHKLLTRLAGKPLYSHPRFKSLSILHRKMVLSTVSVDLVQTLQFIFDENDARFTATYSTLGNKQLYKYLRIVDSVQKNDTITVCDEFLDPLKFFSEMKNISGKVFLQDAETLENRCIQMKKGKFFIEFPEWFQQQLSYEKLEIDQNKPQSRSYESMSYGKKTNLTVDEWIAAILEISFLVHYNLMKSDKKEYKNRYINYNTTLFTQQNNLFFSDSCPHFINELHLGNLDKEI